MKKWIAVLCLLALVGCSGGRELPSSTQGEGSDAMRESPCACEWREFEPDLYDWIES